MTVLKEIYNLKDDSSYIKRVRDASLDKSSSSGLKIEDGLLYGTEDWFNAIKSGHIKTQVISGIISKVYMAGHNDFPEFEIDSNGSKTCWALKGIDSEYIVGRHVELIYAIQKFKRGAPNQCVIKINISADT